MNKNLAPTNFRKIEIRNTGGGGAVIISKGPQILVLWVECIPNFRVSSIKVKPAICCVVNAMEKKLPCHETLYVFVDVNIWQTHCGPSLSDAILHTY